MTAETTSSFPPQLSLQAHRGAAGLAPENTLAAFRMAIELGADAAELDLQATKDGVVVVIHDDTVDRTTDGRGRIGDLTLADIKRLDAGTKFGAAFRGERVPTLSELIDLVKAGGNDRFRLNLEIKFAEGREGQPADLEERVLAVLTQAGFLDRVITQSFHHASAAKMKRLAPSIPAGLLVGQRRQPADPVAADPQQYRRLFCHQILASQSVAQPHRIEKDSGTISSTLSSYHQKNMKKAICSNPIFAFAVHFELLHSIVFDKWQRSVQSNSYKNRNIFHSALQHLFPY